MSKGKKQITTEKRNELLKDLFNAVTKDDVIMFRDGHLFLAGKQLPDIDALNIIQGAKAIKGLDTWTHILNGSRYMANQAMYNNSKTMEDLFFGKAVLFAIKQFEDMVDELIALEKKLKIQKKEG